MSSHILTCLPSPSTHLILESNQLFWLLTSQILHRSRHHLKFLLSTLISYMSLHEPYLECSTSFHTPTSSTPNLHFHLANNAILNFSISLMPNPPASTGLQTVSHDTQAIFLPSCPQPQRNLA